MPTGIARPFAIFLTWGASTYTPTLGDIITLSGTKSTVIATEGFIRFYDSAGNLVAHQDLTIDNSGNTFRATFNTAKLGSGTFTMKWIISNLSANDNFGAVHYKTGSSDDSSQTLVVAAGTTYADPLLYMKNMLSTNWISSNTDGITPGFYTIRENKDRMLIDRDHPAILLYSYAHTGGPNGMGESTKEVMDGVSIDIRSSKTGDFGVKMLKEVERIIDTNLTPGDDYDLIEQDGQTDLCDASRNFWRWVFNVKMEKANAVRGT